MLKEIYEEIWEELQGAEHYAKWALKAKTEHPDFARKLMDMSHQELQHATFLSDEADRRIGHMDAGGKAVHDFVREMQIEMCARVKRYQSQFK